MSYPSTIANLHFQYKTAFDALKKFLPDKSDEQLSSMVLEFKDSKEVKKEPKKDTQKEPKKVDVSKKGKSKKKVDSVPVESVPVESVPVESVPVESVPVESVPVVKKTIKKKKVSNVDTDKLTDELQYEP